ncbi:MAG: hypothetical protein MZV70_76525 [Desulfobacterales bacterium]|nr:hypothetical protein [Desulfobacterales bacterium]
MPLLIFGIFTPKIFTTLFGSNWEIAGIYAQMNVLWIFAGLLNEPAAMTTYILGLQNFNMMYQITLLLLRVLSIVCGFYFFHNHFVSVGLNALTGAACNFCIMYFIYRKVCGNKNDE